MDGLQGLEAGEGRSVVGETVLDIERDAVPAHLPEALRGEVAWNERPAVTQILAACNPALRLSLRRRGDWNERPIDRSAGLGGQEHDDVGHSGRLRPGRGIDIGHVPAVLRRIEDQRQDGVHADAPRQFGR